MVTRSPNLEYVPKKHVHAFPFHDMPTKKCQSNTLKVQPFQV